MSQKISTSIPFQKFHGAGNDFILVVQELLHNIDPSAFASKVCDRNYGIGSDGLIIVAKSERADLKMIFFNPDGTRDVCGNGMRCVALYHYMNAPFNKMQLEIDDGIVDIEALDAGALFRVQMQVREEPSSKSVKTSSGVIEGVLINTGTPHFVTYTDSLESLQIQKLGSELEHHKDFAEAVSIDFVKKVDSHAAQIRIWERSAGETLACGTAACAVTVSLIERGELASPVKITSRGGTLEVSYDKAGLFLTGPAKFVFNGTLP